MLARNLHHGHKINNVTPSIITYLLANADLSKPVSVKTYNGEPKNTGWVYGKKGIKYYIGYNHETLKIEVRENSTQGEILTELDDTDDTYQKVSKKLRKYI